METLIRILVEDVLTFAYCEKHQMNEDFAVAQLERIANQLKSGGKELIDVFISTVGKMAVEARKIGSTDLAEQLDSMPDHLGLH